MVKSNGSIQSISQIWFTDQVSNLALFGLLIKKAQDLALRLNHVKFQYFSRDGNGVVHNLIRYECHVTYFSIWT